MKIVRYKALGANPRTKAKMLADSGARHLWHEFDSAEYKNWELSAASVIITLELDYDGFMDQALYENTICKELEDFWTQHGRKFKKIEENG